MSHWWGQEPCSCRTVECKQYKNQTLQYSTVQWDAKYSVHTRSPSAANTQRALACTKENGNYSYSPSVPCNLLTVVLLNIKLS